MARLILALLIVVPAILAAEKQGRQYLGPYSSSGSSGAAVGQYGQSSGASQTHDQKNVNLQLGSDKGSSSSFSNTQAGLGVSGAHQQQAGLGYPGGVYPGGANPGGVYPGGIYPGGGYPGGVYPGGVYPGGVYPGGVYPGGSYPSPYQIYPGYYQDPYTRQTAPGIGFGVVRSPGIQGAGIATRGQQYQQQQQE